jgi:hypothetical protein
VIEGKIKYLSFYLKVLLKSELNYLILKKKLLLIVFYMKYYQNHLLKWLFVLYTNSKSLIYVFKGLNNLQNL